MRTKRLFTAFSLLCAAFLPYIASAQQGVIATGITGCNFSTGQLRAACIPNFIAYLVQFLFSLLGMFFLLNVIFAGYQIAVSGVTGDKESGKNRLMWSVIGLIVAICAFVILDLVLSVITERL
ncbi:hypothetical protein HZA45_01000 [Candidatus Peregrinibacteria bacterium]|nr:hypothetical protein [Candidatus Peregrinibacteria bacterium]